MHTIYNTATNYVKLAVFTFTCCLGVTTAAAAQNDDSQPDIVQRMQVMLTKYKEKMTQLQSQSEQQQSLIDENMRQNASITRENAVLKKDLAAEKQKNLELLSEVNTSKVRITNMTKLQQATQIDLSNANQIQQNSEKTIAAAISTRNRLEEALQSKNGELTACTSKNTHLYQFGIEMIKLFEKPSAYEYALRNEPFTRLKRVELENLFQDYRDKLDDNKFEKTTKAEH